MFVVFVISSDLSPNPDGVDSMRSTAMLTGYIGSAINTGIVRDVFA